MSTRANRTAPQEPASEAKAAQVPDSERCAFSRRIFEEDDDPLVVFEPFAPPTVDKAPGASPPADPMERGN